MENQSHTQESRVNFLDYWRILKSRWMFVTLIFLVVVLIATIVTYFQPRLYTAASRIKVEHERPTVSVMRADSYPIYDPFFLQTQYEIIQSGKVLYPVIERLELNKVWATDKTPMTMDVALLRLKGALAVRRYRDTSLIEIAVTGTDRELIPDIANTIAEVFERERLEVKRQETLKGINKLRDELVGQQDRVRKAQAEVERLRRELEIPMAGVFRLSDDQMRQLDQQLTVAKVEAAGKEARLRELEKLSPTQLRNAIATVINDPSVQGLLQDLTRSELQLEVLKQDYGPDHPTVRSELASLEKLNEQLDQRLEGILSGIKMEYAVAHAGVVELERQLNAAKRESYSIESEKYLPYNNAKREEESEIRLYEELRQRLQQESVELELPRSPIELIDRAEPPRFPIKPNMKLNLALGAIAGLLLGITLAFFIEFLDTSVKRIEDVERFLDLPVLGVVPQNAGSVARGEASAGDIEAYRMLRTNLEFAKGKNATHSLCAVSAAPGEGKSFSVSNLACICAQHGARVLVVDGDLRRPTMHTVFDVSNETGLADFLVGDKALDEVIAHTTIPNVMIIPAGSGRHARSALPLLTSPRMTELIRALDQQFDLVLYDTPPVLGVSETASLVRDVGFAFLVIQHRRYPRHMARRAKQMVDTAGAKLLGVVINNVAISQSETYFYYHQQYEEYLKAPELRAKAAKADADAARRSATRVAQAAPKEDDEIQLTEKY